MDDLLPVLVGGILAGVGGLIGAWIQGRREHARWLRERRFEAYTNAVNMGSNVRGVAFEVVQTLADLKAGKVTPDKAEGVAAFLRERLDRMSTLKDNVAEHIAALVILGPKSVGDAYVALIDAMSPAQFMDAPMDPEVVAKIDTDAVNHAESLLTDAMRKALGIKDF